MYSETDSLSHRNLSETLSPDSIVKHIHRKTIDRSKSTTSLTTLSTHDPSIALTTFPTHSKH